MQVATTTRLVWAGTPKEVQCCRSMQPPVRKAVRPNQPAPARVTLAIIAELHMLGNLSDFESTEFVLQPCLATVCDNSECMLADNSFEVASWKGRKCGIF